MSEGIPAHGRGRRAWLVPRFAAVAIALAAAAAVTYVAVRPGVTRVPPEIDYYLRAGHTPTDQEIEIATSLVLRTKDAAPRYADPREALADGYFDTTPMQPGVHHWVNLGYMSDGVVLDPDRPESLMYLEEPDGSQTLVGFMYVMQAPGERGPRVGGEMTTWHLHPAYCWSHLGFPVSPPSGGKTPCPPSQFQADTPEMLHVWVIPNRAGVFAEDMDLPPEVIEGLRSVSSAG